jgi:predicted O-methyltransferase YrrM
VRFDQIHDLVGHVRFINKANARFVYDLIVRDKLRTILELGIAHGTATCYMAAALQEIGGGTVTAVDILRAKDVFKPSPEEQLERCGLGQFVRIERPKTGYNWFLHDAILANTRNGVCSEAYDLCIIDGQKHWTHDGAAFFFVDKLLKKDGWLIFDDFNWTFGESNKRRASTAGIVHETLSEAELWTPHIRDVFELLVKQHPNYGNFIVLDDGDWVVAQKTMTDAKTYTLTYRDERNLGSVARSIVYLARDAVKGAFRP